MAGQRRKITELTSGEIDPVVQSLIPFVAGLDRDDEKTAGVIEAIESLFFKLKHGSRAPSIATALDLQELRIYPYGLEFKDDAVKTLARRRGAEDGVSANNFLTLTYTKSLVALLRQHMSRTSLAGNRLLIDIIFLRLASVLSTDDDYLTIIPDWTTLNTPDGKLSLDGVVDYLVAKRPRKYSGLIVAEPVGALSRPDLLHIGSSNIFEARSSSELQSGLMQAVMAAETSCRETHKECARGAVTCGDQWIFFAYQAPKGDDAKYARTEVLDIGKDGENLDLILGILIDWVENAEVFGPQKYFYLV